MKGRFSGKRIDDTNGDRKIDYCNNHSAVLEGHESLLVIDGATGKDLCAHSGLQEVMFLIGVTTIATKQVPTNWQSPTLIGCVQESSIVARIGMPASAVLFAPQYGLLAEFLAVTTAVTQPTTL